jgi:tetratricopeptide (TPR) repeat protein
VLTGPVSRRPSALWPVLLRASASVGLGDFAGADADFDKALARAGDDPHKRHLVLTNRGALRVRQGRWDDAVRDLRAAVRLRPGAPAAYANLAQAYRGRGDLGAAVATLSEAVAQRPADGRLYHTRARLDLDRGDRQAARRDLEQAVVKLKEAGAGRARGPGTDELASACVELAHLKHKAGDYAGARGDAEAALAVRRDYAPAYLQLADTLLAEEDYKGAGEMLDQYLVHGKATAKVHRARGLVHDQLRQYPQALKAYTQALALGQDAGTLCLRGWSYLRLESARPALEDFEAALRLDKGQLDALCGRAHARVHLGRVREALTDVEEALRRGPRSDRLLLNAACVYAQAADRLAASKGGPSGQTRDAHYRHAERAVQLVREALQEVPERERRALWRREVEREALLVPVRSSPGMLDLLRQYGRPAATRQQ